MTGNLEGFFGHVARPSFAVFGVWEIKERNMKVRLILAWVVLVSATLVAQTFRGTILGTVTDPSGAVVSGAQVEVKNTGTGQVRSTTTSGDGSYSVAELPIG